MTFTEFEQQCSWLKLQDDQFQPICWHGMNRMYYFMNNLTPQQALEKELPVAVKYNQDKTKEAARWKTQQKMWPSNMGR